MDDKKIKRVKNILEIIALCGSIVTAVVVFLGNNPKWGVFLSFPLIIASLLYIHLRPRKDINVAGVGQQYHRRLISGGVLVVILVSLSTVQFFPKPNQFIQSVFWPLPIVTDTPTITPQTATATNTKTVELSKILAPTNTPTLTSTLTPSQTPSMTLTQTPPSEPLCFTNQWKLLPTYLSSNGRDDRGCWNLTNWGFKYSDVIEVYMNPSTDTGRVGVYRELPSRNLLIRFQIRVNALEALQKGEINQFMVGLINPHSIHLEGALFVIQNAGPNEYIVSFLGNEMMLIGIEEGDDITVDCSISDLRGLTCEFTNTSQPKTASEGIQDVTIKEEWRNFYIGYTLTAGAKADFLIYDLEIIETE